MRDDSFPGGSRNGNTTKKSEKGCRHTESHRATATKILRRSGLLDGQRRNSGIAGDQHLVLLIAARSRAVGVASRAWLTSLIL
jgi:hypothetical protein